MALAGKLQVQQPNFQLFPNKYDLSCKLLSTISLEKNNWPGVIYRATYLNTNSP